MIKNSISSNIKDSMYFKNIRHLKDYYKNMLMRNNLSNVYKHRQLTNYIYFNHNFINYFLKKKKIIMAYLKIVFRSNITSTQS